MRDKIKLTKHFNEIRNLTVELCSPLKTEDYTMQPIGDVSPPKWHLGHTTWFFEVFILTEFKPGYRIFNEEFHYLFNSYYQNKGERILRANRGNLSRPETSEILKYREYVNSEIIELLESGYDRLDKILFLLELGINHEQQHQELFVTDIKYILGTNPLFPAYTNYMPEPGAKAAEAKMLPVDEGVYEIGHDDDSFFYDNEKSPHKVFLHGFEGMNRLVTNGEYLEFIESGGYEDFNLWLSDGWDWINENNVKSPLYWHKIDGKWNNYTLNGLREINPEEPVTHISYYEADAYAHWKGMRLLTEFEWEVFAKKYSPEFSGKENFLDTKGFHPEVETEPGIIAGNTWEWTGSAYLPYPRYRKDEGALGEYNAKFMVNQMVLRGGSCATPASHYRHTYRNFFQPDKRWQFTGIRLGRHL
jgi:ergothioneine biosynthesis protein EgtB